MNVTLLLTNDGAIRRLNRDFRGIDRPTNVLSFPQWTPRQLSKIGKKGEIVPLGDIVIAYQYVVAEAKKDHKILINHVTHLLIHGLLHLFGYDHTSDTEAGKMERLEKRGSWLISAFLDPYKPVPAHGGKGSQVQVERARQQHTKAPRTRL